MTFKYVEHVYLQFNYAFVFGVLLHITSFAILLNAKTCGKNLQGKDMTCIELVKYKLKTFDVCPHKQPVFLFK